MLGGQWRPRGTGRCLRPPGWMVRGTRPRCHPGPPHVLTAPDTGHSWLPMETSSPRRGHDCVSFNTRLPPFKITTRKVVFPAQHSTTALAVRHADGRAHPHKCDCHEKPRRWRKPRAQPSPRPREATAQGGRASWASASPHVTSTRRRRPAARAVKLEVDLGGRVPSGGRWSPREGASEGASLRPPHGDPKRCRAVLTPPPADVEPSRFAPANGHRKNSAMLPGRFHGRLDRIIRPPTRANPPFAAPSRFRGV